MSDDELKKDDRVTLNWYTPGEPYRPQGKVDDPTGEERARLAALEASDRFHRGEWVLVHWRGQATADQRRWERRADLIRDVDI